MSDPTKELLSASLPSRGVIRVGGPEAAEFLQGLITNDVEKATEDTAIYAALLTPQGKILFDFFVVKSGGGFLLDCHGEYAAALAKRLSMYRLRANVEIEDLSEAWTVIAVFGAGEHPNIGFADPRLAGLGTRVLYPVSDGPAQIDGAVAATEEDYLIWCLSHGLPNIPQDAGQDKTFLLEANFDELNGVDFTKGCYVGQELAARMKHRAKVRKRLMPVTFTGARPEPGTPIMAGEREIGSLRSGIGDRAIALIRLDRFEQAASEQLLADAIPLTVDWPNWLAK